MGQYVVELCSPFFLGLLRLLSLSRKEGNSRVPTNDVFRYDFATGEGVGLMTMPIPARSDHCAVLLDSKIYVFGGLGQTDKVLGDSACFDVRTETWEIMDFRCLIAPAVAVCYRTGQQT